MDSQKIDGQEFTAKFIDTYIGVYFTNKNIRESETLGQFLSPILRKLAPDIVGVYLSGKSEEDL